jgi:heme A synthase
MQIENSRLDEWSEYRRRRKAALLLFIGIILISGVLGSVVLAWPDSKIVAATAFVAGVGVSVAFAVAIWRFTTIGANSHLPPEGGVR